MTDPQITGVLQMEGGLEGGVEVFSQLSTVVSLALC
jgi:hypothetical protein